MDARRRAVLDRLANATEALLVDRTVTEVSLTEIIETSGVAKATVYKLFNDKTHLLQFVVDRLLAVLRRYQLSAYDDVEPENWLGVYTRFCEGAAAFYSARPAAARLWLANDSPASIRSVDQASDAAFHQWIRGRFSGTQWHSRLPDPVLDIDVLTAAQRIYDAVLALGFCRSGRAIPQPYFEEAKRASVTYLAIYLDPALQFRTPREGGAKLTDGGREANVALAPHSVG